MPPYRVPDTVFHTRVREDSVEGPNPYRWQDVASGDIFGGRRVVVYAVPGAFTSACSDEHLPGYERAHEAFAALGVDEVCCVAVNDAFTLFQWAKSRDVRHVRMLPDGNGDFTRGMGMLVRRERHGMGMRSWRYSMLAEDGAITRLFAEPGLRDEPDGVPLSVSDADTMLNFLRGRGR